MTSKSHHLVAIIGRPNVGKSTIFNRMVGERKAILSDIPGTTRDVLIGDVNWQRASFSLADTAGLEPDNKSPLAEDILRQTKSAIADADVILFVVNAIEGLHPDDAVAAELIRKSRKPAILLINKTDAKESRDHIDDFHKLGFKTIFHTSGTSGKGLGDVLDEIISTLKTLPKLKPSKADNLEIIRIAIVGRPNAGKSTLFNRLIGKTRTITSDIAGTTRDAINETLDYKNYRFEFIDTAGLRRRGKVEVGIEKISALKVLRSVQAADICLLLMEGHEGVLAQDMHIMQIILEFHKSPILVVNKWDLVEKTASITAEYDKYLQQKYKFATWIPLAYVSALTGQRIDKLKDLIIKTWQARHFEFPPRELDRLVVQAVTAKPLKGRHTSPQIFEAKQTDVNPPTVQLRTNKSSELHSTHFRFIENTIRKAWALTGTPIVFTIRGVSRKK